MIQTYHTNTFGDCSWIQVQNWRKLSNEEYTPKTRWQWIPTDKLEKWFRHKSRQGILCFASTAHYAEQDKEGLQIGNFVGEMDIKTDDDYPKMQNSIAFIRDDFRKKDIEDFRVWFSGGRSFHFEIPYQCFGIEPMAALNQYYRHIAYLLNQLMPSDCYPLDLSIYSNPRMFRLPNSYYPEYQSYKIELRPEEVFLPIEAMRELAKYPREALTSDFEAYDVAEGALAWWDNDIKPHVDAIEKDRSQAIPVKNEAIAALDELPLCIKHLRDNGPPKPNTRNNAVIQDAAFSRARGISQADAVRWVDSWVRKMPATPSKLSERLGENKKTVDAVYNHRNGNKTYRFSCEYSEKLGLPCAGSDCPLYSAKDFRKYNSRVKRIEVSSYQPIVANHSIETVRTSLFETIQQLTEKWWENCTDDIYAFTFPPGAGKTITSLKALEPVTSHFLYFAQRHKMLDEQKDKFPDLYHIRPRAFVDENKPADLQLCIKPDDCEAFARQRWNAVKLVCTSDCPKQFNCDFRWQFVPRNTALTHEYLFSQTFTDWLCDGVGGIAKPDKWGIVIDEPSISTFLEPVNITSHDLTKHISHTEDENIAKLLGIVRETIEQECRRKEHSHALYGHTVFMRLAQTASRQGVDLITLVNTILADYEKETPFETHIEIPLKFVWDLVDEIKKDMSKQEASKSDAPFPSLKCDKGFNSAMVICFSGNKPTLRLNIKRDFSHVKGPINILGANFEPDLLSALTGRDVQAFNLPIQLKSDNVIQVLQGQYGITSLWHKNKDKPTDTLLRIWQSVQKLIYGNEASTLIVTWKRVAKWLREKQELGELDLRVAIAWYGAVEGLNEYEHRKNNILIGTPQVPEHQLKQTAQAIWADSDKPLDMVSQNVWKEYAYKAEDGSGLQTLVREYRDERINWLLHHYREQQILQAAHRIRPLIHEGKTIYLFSALPIESLPPKKIVHRLEDLHGETRKTNESVEALKSYTNAVLDEVSGIFPAFLEEAKSRKYSELKKNSLISRLYLRDFEKLQSKNTARQLAKVAADLGLESKIVPFGKTLRLKTYHRPGAFDLDKFTSALALLYPEHVTEPEPESVQQRYYHLLQDPATLQSMLNPFKSADVVGIDTETTGLDPLTDRIRTVQIAAAGRTPVVLDMFELADEDLTPLSELLACENTLVFHNAKFDISMLRTGGFEVKGPVFDTQLAHQLLVAGDDEIDASLSGICLRYLGEDLPKTEQLSDWTGKLSRTQLRYAAKDAEILLSLYEKMTPLLVDARLSAVATLEFETIEAIVEKELSGMRVDTQQMEALRKEIAVEQPKFIKELIAYFGKAVNLNSPKQLRVAFKRLGFDIKSTKREVLLPYVSKHPAFAALIEYKRLEKLKSMFLKKFPLEVHPATERIHASYRQLGSFDSSSKAGRLSCSGPNLQQVPRDPRVRACFVPEEGNKYVIADYSQIELRIAAEIADDERMITAYRNDEDLHTLTASLVMDVPVEAVSKDQRQAAKAINFGLIYGMGAQRLAENAKNDHGVDMSIADAAAFRRRFFDAYRGIADWHRRTKRAKSQETRTLSGRRRRFGHNPSINALFNTPVQGTGADILKKALALLPDALRGTDAKIIACVHDEIILETPADNADEVAVILQGVMEAAGRCYLKHVPVVAEARVAESWADK